MATQLHPQAPGQPAGAVSFVPGAMYAYDVEHRSGLVKATLQVTNLANLSVFSKRMGKSGICPVDTGACITSVTGGAVVGYDMYGQFVKETIGAAGTGKIAFASVNSAPADAKWVNKFGLPYKYSAASAPAWGLGTITAPATNEDNRGTYALTSAPTGPQEFEITYLADQTKMMGDPYATRLASPAIDTTTLAVTATVDAAGVCALTTGVSTPAGAPFTATFPDGTTKRGVAGTVMNHTLSPIWMSQYRDTLDAAAADRLIAVGFDRSDIKAVYADVSGAVIPTESEGFASMALEGQQPGTPRPTPTEPPASFNTHSQADTWLDNFVSDTGTEPPDEWMGMTLSSKRSMASSLYDTWIAEHGQDAG